jgi:drug/metabolite transporter (DMT)-like permease
MKSFGIVLIVIGIVMMIIRGITVPTEKNIVDVGPIKIDKKENKWIGWPTYAGAVLAVVGAVLVFSDKKTSGV